VVLVTKATTPGEDVAFGERLVPAESTVRFVRWRAASIPSSSGGRVPEINEAIGEMGRWLQAKLGAKQPVMLSPR
jgi:hypothetical protein